jgi:asparagine synthase (glutamine-hydrolysing)
MSGLCGWLGGTRAPAEVLERMAGGLVPPGGSARQDHAAPGGGLCVAPWEDADSLWVEDEVIAAICGQPRWADDDLATLAARRGNAAALSEAYRRFGAGLFDHLFGSFALAVIEPVRGRALIAIDRMGIEALSMARGRDGQLVFGSSVQAVRRHPAVSSTITSQTIYNYMFYFVVPAPSAVYAEHVKLLPGQYMQIEDGTLKTAFYWRMDYREDHAPSFEERAERLKSTLRTGVSRALQSAGTRPVGAFLSGGLDSSSVSGFFAKQRPGAARTFTIGFDLPRFDESGYAKLVAEHFGTRHAAYFVTPDDVADLLPRLAEAFDEPFGNSSVIPTYYCAHFARENGIEVMLAGDGGDELFAGNARYVEMMRYESYGRIPRFLRKGLIEPVLFGVPGLGKLPVAAKAHSWASSYNQAMPERLFKYSFFVNTPIEHVFEPEHVARIDEDRPIEIAREAYNRPAGGSLLHRMLSLDLQSILADNDLRKVNRMCELAGVRVRYPMLDDDVVRFSGSIPVDVMMGGGRLRDFYKRAMADFLPRAVIDKQKHGFGLPFQQWLKEDRRLKEMVEQTLLSFRERGYLKASFVDQVRTSHLEREVTGADGFAYDLMVLELWLQKHA